MILNMFECCFRRNQNIRPAPEPIPLQKKQEPDEKKAKYAPILYNSELEFDSVAEYDRIFPLRPDDDDVVLQLDGNDNVDLDEEDLKEPNSKETIEEMASKEVRKMEEHKPRRHSR